MTYEDPKAVANGYVILQSASKSIYPEDKVLWSTVNEDESIGLFKVDNPAKLVAAGQVYPFHILFQGIEVIGQPIPDIGVFVFQDSLALDYRMGNEWNPEKVEAFLVLLIQLASLDSEAVVSTEECVQPEVADHFQEVFAKFRVGRKLS